MKNAVVKTHVYYHEAIIAIVEPEHKGKIHVIGMKAKQKAIIPETVLYKKEVSFFDDNKITLKSPPTLKLRRIKNEKLEKILAHLQLKLKINDRYKLKFKEITKIKKL